MGGTRGCRCSGDNGLEQSEAPKRRKEMARINGSTAHRRRAAIFFVCGVRTCVLCVRVVSIGCQTLAGLAAITNDQRLCMGRRYIAPGRSRQGCMHACMQSREKRATPRKVRRSLAEYRRTEVNWTGHAQLVGGALVRNNKSIDVLVGIATHPSDFDFPVRACVLIGQGLTLQARFRIRTARRHTGQALDSFQLSGTSTYFPLPCVVCLLHVGTDGGRGTRRVTYVPCVPMQKIAKKKKKRVAQRDQRAA